MSTITSLVRQTTSDSALARNGTAQSPIRTGHGYQIPDHRLGDSRESIPMAHPVNQMQSLLQSEYDEKRHRINQHFDEEQVAAQAAIERGRAQTLSLLDQQFAQKTMEIDRRAQHDIRMNEIITTNFINAPAIHIRGGIRSAPQGGHPCLPPQIPVYLQPKFTSSIDLPLIYTQPYHVPSTPDFNSGSANHTRPVQGEHD